MIKISIKISDLAPIFREFTTRTGIFITEPAQQALVELINWVEIDPHETWHPQKERLEEYYDQCRKMLPGILNNIVEANRLKERMTTMDIFYWVGNNLTNLDFKELSALCFPGPGQLPPTPMMAFPWNLKRKR
jgi:hypothetical protein